MAAMMSMLGQNMGNMDGAPGAGNTGASGPPGGIPGMPEGLKMPSEEETKKMMDDMLKMMSQGADLGG
jgi:hypothetical protein